MDSMRPPTRAGAQPQVGSLDDPGAPGGTHLGESAQGHLGHEQGAQDRHGQHESDQQATHDASSLRQMVFVSPAMSRLARRVQRLGPRDVTVLLTGESGTGKERVAEAVVRASSRADRPFVRFNCASLGPELAEAELFGHAKGAFTGAVRARPGLFREADGGTLLLDEVGEPAPIVQARLLRVLQSGEVRPVGEERPVSVDVRVIAATHRDLAAMVAEGSFREDLYYRLKVVHLEVPALRDRPEDIPVLARHFLDRYADRFDDDRLREPPELMDRWTACWPSAGRGTCGSWRTPARCWWHSPTGSWTSRSSGAPRRRVGSTGPGPEGPGGRLRARAVGGGAARGRREQGGGGPGAGDRSGHALREARQARPVAEAASTRRPRGGPASDRGGT